MSYLQSSSDKKMFNANNTHIPTANVGQHVQYIPPSTKEVVVKKGVLGIGRMKEIVDVPEKYIVHNKNKGYSFAKAYQNVMMFHQMFLLRAGLITYDRVVKQNKPVA